MPQLAGTYSFALSGVMLGVAAPIIVAVMNGFRHDVRVVNIDIRVAARMSANPRPSW